MASRRSPLVTKKFDALGMLLAERTSTHGGLAIQGGISQRLKQEARDAPNWTALGMDMREAIDMIQHKIARILAGDPTYVDHWDDIAGYARLVADRLRKGASNE